MLDDIVDDSVRPEHPVITASIAHYSMVLIDPFNDGNGRYARILMNLVLLMWEITPAIIRVENKQEYKECLTRADKGDITPFIGFVAKSIIGTQEFILEEFKQHGYQLSDEPDVSFEYCYKPF